MQKSCLHKETHEGPRVPMRWGSSGTEVCNRCGAWRLTLHGLGEWQYGQSVEDAAAEKDDEI